MLIIVKERKRVTCEWGRVWLIRGQRKSLIRGDKELDITMVVYRIRED